MSKPQILNLQVFLIIIVISLIILLIFFMIRPTEKFRSHHNTPSPDIQSTYYIDKNYVGCNYDIRSSNIKSSSPSYYLDWNFVGCGPLGIPNLYAGFSMAGKPVWRNGSSPTANGDVYTVIYHGCSVEHDDVAEIRFNMDAFDGNIQLTIGPRHPGQTVTLPVPYLSIYVDSQRGRQINLHVYTPDGKYNYHYNIDKHMRLNLTTAYI